MKVIIISRPMSVNFDHSVRIYWATSIELNKKQLRTVYLFSLLALQSPEDNHNAVLDGFESGCLA